MRIAFAQLARGVRVDGTGKTRCNSISPACVHPWVVDSFVRANYPGREEERLLKLAEYQSIARMGTPAEVAMLALCLSSVKPSFVTRKACPLGGGVLAL